MTKKKERVERSREERKAEKERKRLIKEANRMLISAPKKSANSMGFLSFDPSGAFCFDGGRCYVCQGRCRILFYRII